jgi:hypothetical protein
MSWADLHSWGVAMAMENTGILIAAIILVALLLLQRKAPFRMIGRVTQAVVKPLARVFRAVTRPIRWIARRLRLIAKVGTKPEPEIAIQSAVGVIARVFATGTEADKAIGDGFDVSTVRIERHKQWFCTWLSPVSAPNMVYDEAQATADFEKARRFFDTSVSTDTNPQNLYEDIESAFIVSMFKDSDKPCFYVLSQFRKTINANVMILSIVFSAIVSFVAVANIMLSTSVDFYGTFSLGEKLPFTVNLWVVSLPIDIPRDFFNRLVFGVASCFVGYCVMWLFYNTEYTQFQRYNGQHLKTYLVDYLAKINNNFRQIQTNAANTMLAEAPVEEMKRDAVLWITNLRWMAFRAFFIESYLKNILFQIRRNSSYYLLLVPLLFLALLLVVTSLMRLPEFNVLNLESEIYRQNSFYLFFAMLLLAYYQYLRRSVSFIWESIEQHDWFKFSELNIQDAMTKILDAYVTQLDRWRGVMKSRS